jgi:hypothetical protein
LTYYNTFGRGDANPAINFSCGKKIYLTGFNPSARPKNTSERKNPGYITDFQQYLASSFTVLTNTLFDLSGNIS